MPLHRTGLKNGALLSKASAEFDVFLTGDQNLEFQQNTTALPIAVIDPDNMRKREFRQRC